MPTSNFQPIRLPDPDCCYKFAYLMANSADPDQLASSEANWSGSTLVAKQDISRFSRTRVKTPRKPAAENVVCICRLLNILANFSNLFFAYRQSVDPDQTAPKGTVWSGSTLFAEMTFKFISRWQSRRQLLWLAVQGAGCRVWKLGQIRQ